MAMTTIINEDVSASPTISETSSSLLMPIWDYYLPLSELVRKTPLTSNNVEEDELYQNQCSQTTSTADSCPLKNKTSETSSININSIKAIITKEEYKGKYRSHSSYLGNSSLDDYFVTATTSSNYYCTCTTSKFNSRNSSENDNLSVNNVEDDDEVENKFDDNDNDDDDGDVDYIPPSPYASSSFSSGITRRYQQQQQQQQQQHLENINVSDILIKKKKKRGRPGRKPKDNLNNYCKSNNKGKMVKHKEKVIIEVDKQILVINQGNWLNWKRGGPCGHCGITVSPQWRRGTSDKPILCNACGTRYRRTGQFNAMSRSIRKKCRQMT